MSSPDRSHSWTRTIKNDTFLISTSPSLIQPQAINAAFDSDFMYWSKPLSESGLKTMLANSLCFGVYAPAGSGTSAGKESEEKIIVGDDSDVQTGSKVAESDGLVQIGLARLVTDYVTIAYLSDVYILPSYQGLGLGKWAVECVQEVLDSWPELRGTLLFADRGWEAEFYGKLMGVKEWPQPKEGAVKGLAFMQKTHKGSGLKLDGSH